MPTATTAPESPQQATLHEAVLHEALTGLTAAPKTLTPWLFYDDRGSQLFEDITRLPEYYLTRTERSIFAAHAAEILDHAAQGSRLTLVELGAGSASKTGILLQAAVERQSTVLYQPIDVSASALDEAASSLASHIPGLAIASQVANYITETYSIQREPNHRVLALYIGSSIGNFSPAEAQGILRKLRDHLAPGDTLLLGTDLAPSDTKPVATLLAAYDDAAGVTAAFNLNVLTRLNRELSANFRLDRFTHCTRWNPEASRIEMHLESLGSQTVHIEGTTISFAAGETIHTENSYKFTEGALTTLLESSGFNLTRTLRDPDNRFAVTLSQAT